MTLSEFIDAYLEQHGTILLIAGVYMGVIVPYIFWALFVSITARVDHGRRCLPWLGISLSLTPPIGGMLLRRSGMHPEAAACGLCSRVNMPDSAATGFCEACGAPLHPDVGIEVAEGAPAGRALTCEKRQAQGRIPGDGHA